MSCCGMRGEETGGAVGSAALWARPREDGGHELSLSVPGIHCAACISTIEKGLKEIPELDEGKVNFTLRQVRVRWRDETFDPDVVLHKLAELGYEARPFDPQAAGFAQDDREARQLLRALAVAGFAAANIMMFSISVWAGAEGATRDFFHWLSAAIAIPAVIYAGQPFFRSAFAALSQARMNMDVPISLAVLTAVFMSLYQTATHQQHAYFDAATSLLFFLLIGRYLDHRMRARARSAVTQLMALHAEGATVLDEQGEKAFLPIAELKPGMRVLVAPGERIPVDGLVEEGESDVDNALITGESNPERIATGQEVFAGARNITGPLVIRLKAAGEDTFLAEMIRLMAAAEKSRNAYVRLADRLAGYYAPAVHIAAGLTLGGWLYATGFNWPVSLLHAISVLIITCPCALGLAVPAVQVVAAGVLFRAGVMVKDGGALERLAEVDTVVFDKTGTLTLGQLRLMDTGPVSTEALAIAAGLAQGSAHPLSRAITEAVRERGIAPAGVLHVRELPGRGLQGTWQGRTVRLGALHWCGATEDMLQQPDMPHLALAIEGRQPVIFAFHDAPRPDARETVQRLKEMGLRVELLSGDREGPVRAIAQEVGIEHYQARRTPQDKLAYIEGLAKGGRKVLMVGDGINDAPALAAGHVSMAPSTASDIGRTAAQLVFLSDSLLPVWYAHQVAHRARRLMMQNFGLALVYNAVAVPVAMLGHATPLFAAVAMSASSIVVVSNALRLNFIERLLRKHPAQAGQRRAASAARPQRREAA